MPPELPDMPPELPDMPPELPDMPPEEPELPELLEEPELLLEGLLSGFAPQAAKPAASKTPINSAGI
jgi:hypothetical protein